MQDKDVSIPGQLRVAAYEAAAREMQDVLSRRPPAFHRIAYRVLGNREDAEDAVQDALLAAYKNLKQFRGESQMSTWLTTIVNNSARMHLRKRSRLPNISLDQPSGEEQEHAISQYVAYHGPSPEDQYRYSEVDRHLKQLLTRLSPLLRKTFWLRVIEELSIRETSLVLGISCEATKAHLFRARARLRRIMNERRPRRRQKCSASLRTGPASSPVGDPKPD
jgi:RNA polymerase sigma-70 factor (ECF subfamily)